MNSSSPSILPSIQPKEPISYPIFPNIFLRSHVKLSIQDDFPPQMFESNCIQIKPHRTVYGF